MRVALLLPVVLIAIIMWWCLAEGPLRTPEAALRDFYEAKGRAEDQLTDPLVLNGRRVAPLVSAEVSKVDMPLRRYAISFLGCSRYEPALPVLRTILGNPLERDYFRADALEATWLIDRDLGLAAAGAYASRSDHLGEVARGVRAGTRRPSCRSWWEAFTHSHA